MGVGGVLLCGGAQVGGWVGGAVGGRVRGWVGGLAFACVLRTLVCAPMCVRTRLQVLGLGCLQVNAARPEQWLGAAL